jgi:hypothetical membrane protein
MFEKAVYAFAVAAVFGIFMAYQHSRGKTPPPAWAAVLHGIFAVAGVVLLLMGVLQAGTGTMHTWALALFVAAALGGLYLVSHHFRRRPLPGAVIALHGVIAVTGFVILLVAVFVVG